MNMERMARVTKLAKEDKKNSRIAREHFAQYNASNDYYLWHVYDSFSQAKEKAFEYCVNLCNELGGYGLCILSHNSQAFTVGFRFVDLQTGEPMFAYITKDYNRYCYL